MVSRPRVDRPEDDIAKFFRRVDRTEVTAPLRSSSVHDGRTRFVGPLSILIEGSGRVDGTLLVNGYLQGAGELDWTGLWNLIGDGKIFGVVEVLADGKIIVGSGGSQVIIDGATGKIRAGDMEIDPADGGKVTFPGGAEVTGSESGGLRLQSGARRVVVNAAMVELSDGSQSIRLLPAGIFTSGLDTITETASGGHLPNALYIADSGHWLQVVADD